MRKEILKKAQEILDEEDTGQINAGYLQDDYTDLEEFLLYDETYGLAERLGFDSPIEAWEANPLVQFSTDPGDLRIVPESPSVGGDINVGDSVRPIVSAQPGLSTRRDYLVTELTEMEGRPMIVLQTGPDPELDYAVVSPNEVVKV